MAPHQRADEFLNLGAAHSAVFLPAFRLKIDITEAEAVFFDNAVYAAVICRFEGSSGISHRTAVAQSKHEVDYKLFKEGWRFSLDCFQKFRGKFGVDSLNSVIQSFFWGCLRNVAIVLFFQRKF